METMKDFYSSTTIPPTAAVATRRVPAKPRTAIVINIFVSVGMFVRNSVISFSPLAVAQCEKKNTAIVSRFQKDRRDLRVSVCDIYHFWGPRLENGSQYAPDPILLSHLCWLEHDFVAVVVLFVGIGFLAFIVLGI
jgi:hypothetical protein